MRRRKDAIAHEADERTRQGGFVAVWMAMVLLVMIGVAAFAVDLVHAYLVGQQVQNAADAAALAGASQIPADVACVKANAAAADLANKNLTDDDLGVGSSISSSCTGPNEMTVDVSSEFDTWFARVIGFPKLTVKRRGIAQYDAKLSMGSPANNLGDIPGDSCGDLGFAVLPSPPNPPSTICATVPSNANQNLFAQIEGPETDKRGGNAYSAQYCSALVDGCDTANALSSNEFANGGDEYFYVKNDAPGQPLLIAVYDGGFVDTGGFCDPATNKITGGVNPLRYVANSSYCAGDRRQPGVDPAGTNAMDTQFDVLAPDGDLDPTNNPVQCSSGDIAGQEPPNGTPLAAENQWFQQWRSICPSGAFGSDAVKDTYIVRVHSATGQGTNNFSLLALHKLGTKPPASSELAISTQERLPLFATKPGGGTGQFYLARVPGSSQPRVLTLDFFDLGDSTCPGGGVCPPDSKGTIAIHPEGAGNFSGCTITDGPTPIIGFTQGAPSVGKPTQEWGTQGSPQTCSFHYDRSTWNGQWVTVQVPIPPMPFYGSSCTFTDFQSCWIKIDMTPDGGTRPLNDATTWNATIGGAPVRLIG
jgi:Flp pilus assembly protein TadG